MKSEDLIKNVEKKIDKIEDDVNYRNEDGSFNYDNIPYIIELKRRKLRAELEAYKEMSDAKDEDFLGILFVLSLCTYNNFREVLDCKIKDLREQLKSKRKGE